MMGKIW